MAREVNNVLELVALADDLQQENQELKKQLEEKESQQKEFIDYLEDCINELKKENRDLRLRLINELGVDSSELY